MNLPVDFNLLQSAITAPSTTITPAQEALYSKLLASIQANPTVSGSTQPNQDGLRSYQLPEVQARIPTQAELDAAAALPDEAPATEPLQKQMPPEQTGLSTPVYGGNPPAQEPGGLSPDQLRQMYARVNASQAQQDSQAVVQSPNLPPFFGMLAGPGGSRQRSVTPPTPQQQTASGTSTTPSTVSGTAPATGSGAAGNNTQGAQTPVTVSGMSLAEYEKRPLGSSLYEDQYNVDGQKINKPRTASPASMPQTFTEDKSQVYGTGLQFDMDAASMKDDQGQYVEYDGNDWTVYTADGPIKLEKNTDYYNKLMQMQSVAPAKYSKDYSTVSYGLPNGQPITLKSNYYVDGTPGPERQYYVRVSQDGDVVFENPATGSSTQQALGDYPFRVTKNKLAKAPAYGKNVAADWGDDGYEFYQPETEQVLPAVRQRLDGIYKYGGGLGFDKNGEVTRLGLVDGVSRFAKMLDPNFLSELAASKDLQRQYYGAAAGEEQEGKAMASVEKFWNNMEDEAKGSIQQSGSPNAAQINSIAANSKIKNSVQQSMSYSGGNVYTTDEAKAQQAANILANQIALDPTRNLGVLLPLSGSKSLTAGDIASFAKSAGERWINGGFRELTDIQQKSKYGSFDEDGEWVGNFTRFANGFMDAVRNNNQEDIGNYLSVIAKAKNKTYAGLSNRSGVPVNREPQFMLQRSAAAGMNVTAAPPPQPRNVPKTSYQYGLSSNTSTRYKDLPELRKVMALTGVNDPIRAFQDTVAGIFAAQHDASKGNNNFQSFGTAPQRLNAISLWASGSKNPNDTAVFEQKVEESLRMDTNHLIDELVQQQLANPSYMAANVQKVAKTLQTIVDRYGTATQPVDAKKAGALYTDIIAPSNGNVNAAIIDRFIKAFTPSNNGGLVPQASRYHIGAMKPETVAGTRGNGAMRTLSDNIKNFATGNTMPAGNPKHYEALSALEGAFGSFNDVLMANIAPMAGVAASALSTLAPIYGAGIPNQMLQSELDKLKKTPDMVVIPQTP